MTPNSPIIFFPVHKEPIMDEMFAKDLVGVRCHENNFLVDDPSGTYAICSESQDKAESWITTDGGDEGRSTVNSMISMRTDRQVPWLLVDA
jgi:hypothetical protein